MYKSNGKLSHKLPDTRIAPDRRWFSNNRTITQDELASYQNAYTEAKSDPFQVILHERLLPKSLVHDQPEKTRFDLLRVEPFQDTFGKSARRRKPVLDACDLRGLMDRAQAQEAEFLAASTRAQNDSAEADMGQTKRILGEVYKVIDSSTVVVEVLDARDPLGSRSRKLEEFMAKETPHKHLIFLLNKCDLVPRWVVEKAVRRLTRERPTLAFRASTSSCRS
jgi:nuclear GTP-binding protein